MYRFAIGFIGMLLLGACSTKAVYIEGGANSSATLEAGMTGGRINIIGPFVYCEERYHKNVMDPKPSVEKCPTLQPEKVQ